MKLNESIVIPNLEEFWRFGPTWTVVIITWWAIVWTVAYISLQWYSEEAKKSKVTSDIRTILTAISIKEIEWNNVFSMIVKNDKNRISDLSLAWKKATEKNYKVWTLNYTALWIKKENFTDPYWNEYIIWATNTWRNRFEISWVGEYSSIKKWNYIWRDDKKYNIDEIKKEKNIIILSPNSIKAFYKWDYVQVWVMEYNILKVARDWITVTLDRKIIWNPKTINLLESEWENLILNLNKEILDLNSNLGYEKDLKWDVQIFDNSKLLKR